MPIPAALVGLGPIGVRGAMLDRLDAQAGRALVRRIESLGFASIWIPESTGHEVFSQAGLLLAATEKLVVGTGIANVYARDAAAMAAGGHTLADAYPGRFVLGLGVSHAPMIERRGHDYRRPLTYLRDYVTAMDAAPYRAPLPRVPAPRVIGALGPRSLAFAGSQGMGAHPYFVPVEHSRRARGLLGPDAFLAPEVAVVCTISREVARERSRSYLDRHLGLANYRNNLLRLGYRESDLDPPSDRLLDDLVAWGGPAALQERIDAHRAAGADHIVLHPVATVDAAEEELPAIIEQLAQDVPTRQQEQS